MTGICGNTKRVFSRDRAGRRFIYQRTKHNVYGKIFRQIYDSTLADDWRALVTFQQLLVLCDAKGVVDMTPGAISRTTGIPLDVIEPGLEKLEKEDPQSRSTVANGRRVVRLDDSRSWGWQIVNYIYYHDLVNREDKREKDRERIAERRKKEKEKQEVIKNDVAECRKVSLGVATCNENVASTDPTTTTDLNNNSSEPNGSSPVVTVTPKIAITLTLNDKSEYSISMALAIEFQELYPGITVLDELRKMRAWCIANPTKRKTKRGILRFVNHWLAKEQDRGKNHEANNRIDNSAPARVQRGIDERERKRQARGE